MYQVLDFKAMFVKRGIFDGYVGVELKVVYRLFYKATFLSVYDVEFFDKAFLEVIENLTKESQPTASFCSILELASQMPVAVVGNMTSKPYSGLH